VIALGRKAKKDMEPPCCKPATDLGGYKVEAMVSVDERGQMVMPKELRDKIGIKAGDKLVVLSWQKEGDVCCISLIKTDYFLSVLKDKLGPMMDELAARK
jgi:AbrB family looped-hinge helix DNA binding protein